MLSGLGSFTISRLLRWQITPAAADETARRIHMSFRTAINDGVIKSCKQINKLNTARIGAESHQSRSFL